MHRDNGVRSFCPEPSGEVCAHEISKREGDEQARCLMVHELAGMAA